MPSNREVVIVLPVHNEVGSIEGVVRGFQAAVIDKHPGSRLLIAEDGSRDGTPELLSRLQAELGFELLTGRERKGYLAAVRDALLSARSDWVFFSDTDGTHDPADFWKLWDVREDADLVAGYKERRKDPFYRKFASRCYNWFIGAYFGFRVRDSNAGFKLLRSSVVAAIVPQVRHLKVGFSSELIIRAHAAGFRIRQVPVDHRPRTTGRADQFPLTRMPRIGWDTWRGLRRIKRETRAA